MCSNVRLYSGFSIHIIILYCLIVNQYSFGLTVSDLYPYGPQNGDRETARLDDGGSGQIDLNSTFKFFGRNYTKLFVSIYIAYQYIVVRVRLYDHIPIYIE